MSIITLCSTIWIYSFLENRWEEYCRCNKIGQETGVEFVGMRY